MAAVAARHSWTASWPVLVQQVQASWPVAQRVQIVLVGLLLPCFGVLSFGYKFQ